MRAKKYGAPAFLKNSVMRRHLFYNQRKGLSLDEVLEYQNCRCVGKWWEVRRIEISENSFSFERRLVTATPVYSVAWEMVKDADFVPVGRRV